MQGSTKKPQATPNVKDSPEVIKEMETDRSICTLKGYLFGVTFAKEFEG